MTEHPRPLLITGDSLLLDDVIRLAMAAGVEMNVLAEPSVSAWGVAPLVFVGEDALASATSKALPRRGAVIIVRRRMPSVETPTATWHGAVALGAEHVAELPDAERWIIDRLSQSCDAESPGGPVVSCVAGVGGAGATTLAALLARETRGLLVDVDPYGPVIPVDGGLRWPDLADTRGRVPPASLRNALPTIHGAHVLTGSPDSRFTIPGAALDSVLEAGSRGFACTVVDTPRADADASRIAWGRSDLVIVIVGPHPSSVSRVPALLDGIREVCTRVAVVARTSPRDSGVWCAVEEREWEVPVLPRVRHDRVIAQGDHVYFTPRGTGRCDARAILAATMPEVLTR